MMKCDAFCCVRPQVLSCGGGALEKKEMLVTRAKMFSSNYLTPTYCGDNNVNEMFNV